MYDIFQLAPITHFFEQGNINKLLLMAFLMSSSYAMMIILSDGVEMVKEKIKDVVKSYKEKNTL